jgi:type IV pilus assembly protein PilM
MAKRVSKNRSLVGLDIEPSGISAVQVSMSAGVLKIEQGAMIPLDAGIVRDGEVTDVEALSDALRTLYKENKGFDKRVRVGVANQKIVVRVVELPPIADPKEMDAAVRFRAQDEIPMPLESAVLDFHPLDVVDTAEGPRQRVLVVAARRDMIDRVLTAVRAAGLRPEGVDLAAFAMIRALYQPGPDDAVMYLSVGGLTNLAVAQGTRCVFTRVVGGGLESLAVELAERRALTLDHARAWLTHVGIGRPLETIEGEPEIVSEANLVLSEGVRRIAVEARNSLDFHIGQDGAPQHVSRVVLTGAAATVPGFGEALSIELGLPVDVRHVDGAPADVDAGRLSVAAGLAITESLAA